MNSKRRALLAAILATSTAMPADAGCLDWLFGKQSTTPYAVGFAPQTTVTPVGPLTPMGAPVFSSPVTSGFAPQTAAFTPYAAGFASSFQGINPASAAQAPAFGSLNPFGTLGPVDNPSVLTGQPVMQTSAMQPSTMAFNGMPLALPPAAMAPPAQPSASSSWFGKMLGSDYQTSYYGVPTTTYRPVTQIDPTTGAMVTVQQPCTSTTQQVQRSPYASLQPAQTAPAVPYYGEATCGNEPPRYAPPSSYGAPSPFQPQAGYPPVGNYSQPSGVSQATAIAPSNGYATPGYGAPNYGTQGYGGYAAPIPSTAPYNGAMPYQPQNTQPLSGYPGTYSGAAPSDTSPLAAPQLDSMRPAWSTSTTPPTNFGPTGTFNSPATGLPSIPPSAYPSTSYPSSLAPSASTPLPMPPSSTGTLEAPPLPTTSAWPDRSAINKGTHFSATNSLATKADDKYSDIPPIPASNDYAPPNWSKVQNPWPSADGRDRFGDRLPTDASLSEPRSAAIDLSWRYASSPNGQSETRVNELPPLPLSSQAKSVTKRDDSGWFVIEPR